MGQPQVWKDCGLLLILCLWMFFMGSGSLPVTDPTESNYALTAKEMLEAGEYISPRIYGTDWFDKPILFYWELMAAFHFLGINEFAARFFPAVFATLGVLGTYFFAGWLYDRKRGLISALLLMTSLEYWYIAHAIITDMTLFCSMSAALMLFYAGYQKKEPKYYYGAYAAAGIAVLTKGPIGLCMPGLIIMIFLAWQRDLSHLLRMRMGRGMVIFFAIISIWYLPMFFLHGGDFIKTFFGVHNVLRATVSEHPEMNRWYYYIMIFLAGFMPWVVPLLAQGLRTLWKGRIGLPHPEEKERFLLVWALTVPMVFQCVATKYLTYTFPYMLPVAVLMAGYFAERERLFYRMMVGCLAVLPLLMFLIAVPVCYDNSQKQEAAAVLEFADDSTCVAVCRSPYPASLTFYSGLEVFRLVSEKDKEHLKPRQFQWTSLNVMPFMTFSEMPKNRPVLVVVEKEREEYFEEFILGEWIMVKELPRSKLYLREPPP